MALLTALLAGCGPDESDRPPWRATTVVPNASSSIPEPIAAACSFDSAWVSASPTPPTPPTPSTLDPTPITTSVETHERGATLGALRGQRPNSGAPGPITTLLVTDQGEAISFAGRYRHATLAPDGVAAVRRCITISGFADLTADELGTTGMRPDGSTCTVGDAVTTTVVAATPDGLQSVQAYSLGLPAREQSAFACLRHSTALVALHGQLRQIATRSDEIGTPWEPTRLWVRADPGVIEDRSISPAPPSIVWPTTVAFPSPGARVIEGDEVATVRRALGDPAITRDGDGGDGGTTNATSTDRSEPAGGAAAFTTDADVRTGFRYLVLLPGDPQPD